MANSPGRAGDAEAGEIYDWDDSAKEWVKDKIAEIRMEEEFPPNVEYFFCKHLCGLHNECVYYPSKYKKRGV